MELLKFQVEKKKSLCPTNYYFLKSLSLRTKILLGEKITTSFLDANIWQALWSR